MIPLSDFGCGSDRLEPGSGGMGVERSRRVAGYAGAGDDTSATGDAGVEPLAAAAERTTLVIQLLARQGLEERPERS
jgi:hypothetical protein